MVATKTRRKAGRVKVQPKAEKRTSVAGSGNGVVSIGDLKPDPQNARKHNPRNIGSIVNSLHAVGAARSIVIDEHDMILAGHGLVEAAGEAGITKLKIVEADGNTVIAVRRTGLTPKQKAELAIADNRTTDLSEFDAEQLLKTIAEYDIDIAGIEFNEDEIRALQVEAEGEKEVVEDEVPSDVPTRCKPGELWKLGGHRLLCGDSTKAEDVGRVMDGEKASLCFTSPPYGASDVAKFRDKYVPGAETIKSFYSEHKDDAESWPQLMDGWWTATRPHVEAVICNVQMLANNKRALWAWVGDKISELVDVVMWDKARAAPQMQQRVLSNVFEFIFIFGGNGSRTIPFSDFHGSMQNIVRIDPGQNEFSDVHKAVFPVKLAAWVLGELCVNAKSVLDPFLGSGTTIIAAEQLGRRCYGIEISAAYCDVVLARWEKLTGKQTELVK